MTGAATKTETYTYVYEGESILMEVLTKVENGGAPVKEVTRYVHSQRIDEPLAMERGGQYYYFHSNRLGSIAAITNTAKAIVQSYTYDSFGMPEPSTSFRNSYTYTGREWDGETGLYYYRARYYDPMAGRFVSKDPIGFNGGDVNLYGYVGGNPVNIVDPTGLDAELCTRPFYPYPIPYAQHCYLRFNGDNNDTSSFDNTGVHPDPAPNWWPKQCQQTKGNQNDDCVKDEMQKCQADDYDVTGFNCCHCAEQAMKSCGINIPVNNWPNWPVNPGPQPGEPGYKP